MGPFEALTTLERLAPQVILLDVAMPGVDGYHILRHLRADARLANSFVLMVTASVGLSEMAAGIECGADDYLTKPFAVDELLARVRIGLGFSGSAC